MKRHAQLRPAREWKPEAIVRCIHVSGGQGHRESGRREVPISVPRIRFLETPADKYAALDRQIAARIALLRTEGNPDAH